MKTANQPRHSDARPFGDERERVVLQAVAEEVRRQLPFTSYALYLFGSRVGERATVRSDYDIGLQSSSPLPLAEIARLRDKLDALPIMQKIDLVDLNRVSTEFSQRVRSSGRVIDER